MQSRWALADALMGGSEAMRDMSTTLLPRHQNESDTSYKNRIERTFLLPAFAQAPKAPNRLAVVYLPNGIMMDSWTPSTEGSNFELKPILQLPHVQRELNWEAVGSLFATLATPTTTSIVKGIDKLEPGHIANDSVS